ncbi:MAG: hypothetical protein BroJett030_27190 [Alphaproteobacteria bacterium]|nr:MAG: hypothetical protein BroJett030_27190 [Alphaproteobacteria bacterium]
MKFHLIAGIAGLNFAIGSGAAAAPASIQYEFVDSVGCHLVERMRFAGGKLYHDFLSVSCGAGKPLESADHGSVYTVGKTVTERYTCTQKPGDYYVRCSNGNKTKVFDNETDSETKFSDSLTARVSESAVAVELRSRQTGWLVGKSTGRMTTNISSTITRRIAITGTGCQVVEAGNVTHYGGSIGTKRSALRKPVNCRVK